MTNPTDDAALDLEKTIEFNEWDINECEAVISGSISSTDTASRARESMKRLLAIRKALLLQSKLEPLLRELPDILDWALGYISRPNRIKGQNDIHCDNYDKAANIANQIKDILR